MFISNIADFDQLLPQESAVTQDKTRNRVQADLELFKSVANLAEFSSTPVILLFNHADEFEKKVESATTEDLTVRPTFPKLES